MNIRKYEIFNRIIIIFLLFLSVILSILCLYLYQMIDFKEVTPPTSKPSSEMIKVEPYTCYEGISTYKSEYCNCLFSKSKQVARLKGDTPGVKNFNQKLDELIAIYSNNEEIKNGLVYSCQSAEDKLEMSYNFKYDSVILEDRYIALRIKTTIIDNPDIDKIFYFDVFLDEEIDIDKFTWDLKSKYGKELAICEDNDCKMNDYERIQ